jgi:hypothetical protein
MYFILIMIVFMFAFGVSTQALLYPNQNLNTTLLASIFLPAYFILAGDYYTRDSIMGAINGGVNSKNNLCFFLFLKNLEKL